MVRPSQRDWARMFARLEAFRARHGHARVPALWPDRALARWVLRQRELSRDGRLSAHQRATLERLGFAWRADQARQDDLWERRFRALQRYRKRYGHAQVPTVKTRGKSFALSAWVLQQRSNFRAGTLDPERQMKLEQLGFVWDARDAQWRARLAELVAWRAQHGDCRPPVYLGGRRVALATWVTHQRTARRDGRLAADRVLALDALDFDWRLRPAAGAEERLRALRSFFRQHGHLCVPTHKQRGLVRWMNEQRALAAAGELGAQIRHALDALGFPWTPEEEAWERSFRRAKQHVDRGGRLSAGGGGPLARWLRTQRTAAAQGRLEARRRIRLRALGLLGGRVS